MKLKEKYDNILGWFSENMPVAESELNFTNPFQLLVAVVLSAQCTDKRVNQVTETLFKEANTPIQFAEMPQEKLERLIFSCGFYRNKAKNIISASKDIVERLDGKVPDTIDGLLTLAGVGRKTANVVYAVGYGGQAMPVDTHVFRTSHRLGLSEGKTPDAVEKDLRRIFPESSYTDVHHLLIFHGRYVCKSQRPDCAVCSIKEYCVYDKNQNGNKNEKSKNTFQKG